MVMGDALALPDHVNGAAQDLARIHNSCNDSESVIRTPPALG